MDTTTTLPPEFADVTSTTALEARLQSVSSEVVSPELERTSASIVTRFTSFATEAIGNDTLILNSTYNPGNWSSHVNVTRTPTEIEDLGIKRLVVILTNIFVVIAIVITCFLAFHHRRWEKKMRRERQNEPICKYDVVGVEEGEEDIGEDYEIFDK
ncbi:uncharacterized protein LOC121427761 [Lytechinus variegatus]|uniref:uncharacterized protein LOC121427761 n=1 Tax=Lytechinus variegatus TaxID=7654 RepID=UPI001BB289CA|nr:uncharacterized protein LOC121427761 [Lytechinus variegatus]XP_041480245.1 uncharacterized protein LOC121427761 [Lytechinus variegatus]XP_041480246.1 uncharacterized protein LOC121427761 [Lytechinus variegatus]